MRKLKVQKSEMDKQDLKLQELAKFKQQTTNLTQLNAKVQADLTFYRNQCDKFKIALIEYDRTVNRQVIGE